MNKTLMLGAAILGATDGFGAGRVDVQGGGRRSNARKRFGHCSRCGCRRAIGHQDCRPAMLVLEAPGFRLESVQGDGHGAVVSHGIDSTPEEIAEYHEAMSAAYERGFVCAVCNRPIDVSTQGGKIIARLRKSSESSPASVDAVVQCDACAPPGTEDEFDMDSLDLELAVKQMLEAE